MPNPETFNEFHPRLQMSFARGPHKDLAWHHTVRSNFGMLASLRHTGKHLALPYLRDVDNLK